MMWAGRLAVQWVEHAILDLSCEFKPNAEHRSLLEFMWEI